MLNPIFIRSRRHSEAIREKINPPAIFQLKFITEIRYTFLKMKRRDDDDNNNRNKLT
jgi:hypothetical protein